MNRKGDRRKGKASYDSVRLPGVRRLVGAFGKPDKTRRTPRRVHLPDE